MKTKNYHYIVAGLPELLLEFENKSFNFARIEEGIRDGLDAHDQRLIDWLFFGRDPNRLSSHFYNATKKIKNGFIRNYVHFDMQLRNILAAMSARKAGQKLESSLMGNDSLTEALSTSKAPDFGIREDVDFATTLFSIIEGENILEREQKIDQLRWDKADEINAGHYFDIDVILCFLLKASIIDHWMQLDKIKGQELFKVLVKEITNHQKQIQQ